MVKVFVFGQSLRDCVDDPEIECSVDAPMTIAALMEANPDRFKGLLPFLRSSQLMMTVNQKISTSETLVHDGDTIKLTPQSNPEYEGTLWHNA